MANEDIKQKMKDSNIKFWEVANKYGLTDGNFSRKLRIEFTDAEKEKVLNIIESIRKEKK